MYLHIILNETTKNSGDLDQVKKWLNYTRVIDSRYVAISFGIDFNAE